MGLFSAKSAGGAGHFNGLLVHCIVLGIVQHFAIPQDFF